MKEFLKVFIPTFLPGIIVFVSIVIFSDHTTKKNESNEIIPVKFIKYLYKLDGYYFLEDACPVTGANMPIDIDKYAMEERVGE
jgi:hypothetical protein